MRKFARFAALSLSVAAAPFAATPLVAADLRPIDDPARIASVFPRSAKLRLVNVWATWCIPCVAEMPVLRAISETLGPEVAVVGISLDDMLPDAKQETVATFLDERKIAFPNVYYTGNADALGEHLRITGEIPVTIVYDAKGTELWRHTGLIERDSTIAELRTLLRRKQ